MSKFERKFGRYAIKNLTTVMVACYVIGYLLQLFNGNMLTYLTLDAYKIIHGQIWRLVTWVLVPPSAGGFSLLNIFFMAVMLYFYWSIGTTLERVWGTYRYNVYIFSGMLFMVLGSFATLGVSYLLYYGKSAVIGSYYVSGDVLWIVMNSAGALYFSTSYINLSIFLAFAATFPDTQVYLMFLIPIKMKWLGILDAILIGYEFLCGSSVVMYGAERLDTSLFSRIAIVASLLNFILFFFTSRKRLLRSPRQIRRSHEFKREAYRSTGVVTRHKCAICGRTDESHPELEFRFCSKCNGNYEYCQDHLFTHKHVE